MTNLASKQNSFGQTGPVAADQDSLLSSSGSEIQEEFMNPVLRVAKRLLPIEEIALVEPFAPMAESPYPAGTLFQSRIVLLDKDGVLCEQLPENFADSMRFGWLAEDRVALNPAVRFAVEVFEPQEGFQPQKAFRTRLLWKDWEGTSRSKLLLATPESVLAVARRAGAKKARTAGGKRTRRATHPSH